MKERGCGKRERERERERERGGERDSETEGGENSAQTIGVCERGRNRRREEPAGKQ